MVLEFELRVLDDLSPISPRDAIENEATAPTNKVVTLDEWSLDPLKVLESTTSFSKPIPALERLRRVAAQHNACHNPSLRKHIPPDAAAFTMPIMAQINEQLSQPTDLQTFLKVLVGVIRGLIILHSLLLC